MMVEPSINSLLKKTGNLYFLCNFAGRRARQLVDGAPRLAECDSNNEVSIATNEIDECRITGVGNNTK